MAGRVAVVGATGHIGRPLCRELMRAGHSVTAIPPAPRQLVHGAADYVERSPASRLTPALRAILSEEPAR